jgi:hypothetical protein
MATAGWVATLGGTSAVNDIYIEAGTLWGRPYYVGQAHGWYLYWGGMSGPEWRLDPTKGAFENVAYYGTGWTLPANDWTAGAGEAPAPVLSAAIGLDFRPPMQATGIRRVSLSADDVRHIALAATDVRRVCLE